MIIKNYMDIMNIHNWLKDSYTFSSIEFVEESTLFEKNDINDIESSSDVSFDKLIGYNYVYNYFYFLQKYIKSKNMTFSFSGFKNIYDLKEYADNQQDVDIKAFSGWFFKDGEGLSNIINFIGSLNTDNYESDKIFKILKYYNYLIEDSIFNDPETIQTFLTEGSIDPFIKVSKFVIRNNAMKNSKDEDNSILYNIELSKYNPWETYCLNLNFINNFEEPTDLQVPFYNIKGVLQ